VGHLKNGKLIIPKNKTNLTFSPFVSFGESGENVKMVKIVKSFLVMV